MVYTFLILEYRQFPTEEQQTHCKTCLSSIIANEISSTVVIQTAYIAINPVRV
jgi:hypothetical protein